MSILNELQVLAFFFGLYSIPAIWKWKDQCSLFFLQICFWVGKKLFCYVFDTGWWSYESVRATRFWIILRDNDSRYLCSGVLFYLFPKTISSLLSIFVVGHFGSSNCSFTKSRPWTTTDQLYVVSLLEVITNIDAPSYPECLVIFPFLKAQLEMLHMVYIVQKSSISLMKRLIKC